MNAKLTNCICVAALIRIILLFYGQWQDSKMKIKYTDADYFVFSDASKAIYDGQNPYNRGTYRYTPFLAFLLLPNNYLHQAWGKALFIVCDLLVGYLVFLILIKRKLKNNDAIYYACFWLFNPVSINMSTRGNADCLITFLILSTLFAILKDKIVLAGLLYGLAVHMRIYPIIYCLCLFLALDKVKPFSTLNFFTLKRIKFTLVSASTFFILLYIGYIFYGFECIQESYLYHLSRTDNRHNFSVYFYTLYLNFNEIESRILHGFLSFLPQLILLPFFSLIYFEDVCLCLFLLTQTFVIFNKVCTAQYFLWYLGILPLIIPFSSIPFKHFGLFLITLWMIGEMHWLYWAYELEFLGLNSFLNIWISGLIFFICNIIVMVVIILYQEKKPLLTYAKK